MEELDLVNGAGLMYMRDDTMNLVLMLHMVDEFTFECKLAEGDV